METDRAVQAAQQNLAGMSDAQRAAATIGLTANQGQAAASAITEANRFNNQAQNTADIYNAKIGDAEQIYENQNALSYEARTLKGLSNYENDWQNLRNTRFNDQMNNYKTVEMYNAQNASNPQIQYRGTGLGYETNYTPEFSKAHAGEINTTAEKVAADKIAADKLAADKAAAAKKVKPAKFGGRFKKK
jgi:hypothetical protein